MSSMMCGMLLGAGVSTSKTYVDDAFSTYLYKGTQSDKTITNGVDLSGEGGMVWIKNRSSNWSNNIFDTVRGVTKKLVSDGTNAEETNTETMKAFNTNGFQIGNNGAVNASGDDIASWTFRKTPGFCDVVTYTGNGVDGRTISHSLGCAPGFILFKRTDGTGNWFVWHKEFGLTQYALLNLNNAAGSMGSSPRHALPNATTVTLTDWDEENGNGHDFVAYLFAGGESGASEAVSVDFDGSGDVLMAPASSDYSFGSGDFTVEGWFKLETTSSVDGIIGVWDNSNSQRSWMLRHDSVNNLEFYVSTDGSSNTMIEASGLTAKTWYHFAAVRTGNTLKLFLNGVEKASTSFSGTLYDGSLDPVYIGSQMGSNNADGAFSNIRITKGQALYTSTFRVPISPLTTTSQGATASNVKLLCCNNSSVTGATVSSGTLTTSGDPTASSDSPFDDPAGFVFGESGSENVIKTGSYVGSGSAGLEVNLGFEPQWVMWKRTSGTSNWYMVDSMRGIVTGGDDPYLAANENSGEGGGYNPIEVTPTGFKLTTTGSWVNNSGEDYIFMAIRRPDGYVGKPVELGTDVFGLTTGAGSTSRPSFVPNFPVAFNIFRKPGENGQNWQTSARLIGPRVLYTNTSDAEGAHGDYVWDSNVGVFKDAGSDYQAWSWKRHAGFDVVCFKGNETAGHQISHSMNAAPEMMWLKPRAAGDGWNVYHKGLNGGTNPQNYAIMLNTDAAERDINTTWNDTAPTATHFTLGNSADTNRSNSPMLALLFSSVDGISKCGFYDGSSSDQAISLGFQPRFLIIKIVSGGATDWMVYDTTRGWPTWAGSKAASGLHKQIQLNTNGGQYNAEQVWPTSTGFHLLGGENSTNNASRKYIYYAHA
jgi:hypothetical protein